jgi:hypothetical protein
MKHIPEHEFNATRFLPDGFVTQEEYKYRENYTKLKSHLSYRQR